MEPASGIVVTGEWGPGLDGGSPDYATWRFNPLFALRAAAPDTFVFNLTQTDGDASEFKVGLLVLRLDDGAPLPETPSGTQKIAGSSFRDAALVDWSVALPRAGLYLVIASTAEPEQHGDFTLRVKAEASSDFTLESYDLQSQQDSTPAIAPEREENQRVPPPLPSGLGSFDGWSAEGIYASALATARQQVSQGADGFTDAEFEVQAVNPGKVAQKRVECLHAAG